MAPEYIHTYARAWYVLQELGLSESLARGTNPILMISYHDLAMTTAVMQLVEQGLGSQPITFLARYSMQAFPQYAPTRELSSWWVMPRNLPV